MFPTALYHCRSLRYLNISHNYIEGEIPNDIGLGLSPNLSTLDLSGNELNGTMPSSLSRLQNLEHLLLHDNHLTGTYYPSRAQRADKP